MGNIIKNELLNKNLIQIEYERFEYTTTSGAKVLFQRMNKDFMWYAVSKNQIVAWGKYRNDLQEWCDVAL